MSISLTLWALRSNRFRLKPNHWGPEGWRHKASHCWKVDLSRRQASLNVLISYPSIEVSPETLWGSSCCVFRQDVFVLRHQSFNRYGTRWWKPCCLACGLLLSEEAGMCLTWKDLYLGNSNKHVHWCWSNISNEPWDFTHDLFFYTSNNFMGHAGIPMR